MRTCSCCSSEPRFDVREYFVRALSRSRDKYPFIEGDIINGNDRLCTRYYLGIVEGRIEEVSYQCNTCVVLLAYCERLAEMVVGISPANALQIKSMDLISMFPEVPDYKHDRAFLALKALQSAVSKVV